MRVFFVGMHNKAGMKPLDSKTMSGKMIDSIIKEMTVGCIKTNLCECEYQPMDKQEITNWGTLWHEKYSPCDTDVIVLLGAWVHKYFIRVGAIPIIKLPHPASCMGNVNKENYILNAIQKLKQ